ncbi:MAG: hypothetical protein A3C08_01750 [Candidatus Taylorbacteria bacterium RIFCSPHIGHO2_02_FULL_47_18]|nr:MAG: hypothetical protein A3C08_01750 [Candidatus Taylorbacteria bacterium RIFCSPHIGHO2_02_FULL_47_18]
MSRIENEQGCTLSKSEDIKTSGRSHVPSWLMFHIMDEVAGLFFRITRTTMAARITLMVIIIFFIPFTGLP